MADLLLQQARCALQDAQLDRALQLLQQASAATPLDPNVWFTLATALARKGGQQAMCCIAYMRTLQLLAAGEAEEPQTPANAAMASVSADNCWLLAEKLLPTAWPSALQDAALTHSMHCGLLHHLSALLQQQDPASGSGGSSSDPHVQLLCVGGMGVQAMQLAAAASDVQGRAVEAAEAAAAAGSTAAVPSMGLAFVPSSQLTAHVASQLLLDNGLDDIVDVATWPEFMQHQLQQDPPTAALALLAGAVQPNWGPAVTACMQAMHRLAAFASNSSSRGGQEAGSSSSMECRVCPGKVTVWAAPVTCKELLDLNQVDLQAAALQRWDYTAANTRLRRSSRPAQVARHSPELLAAPVPVLQVSLQDVLQQLRQRYQSAAQQRQQGTGSAAAASAAAGAAGPCAAAAALAAGRAAEASTAVTVQQTGRVDCLVWWLEFEWAPGHSTAFAPSVAATATAAVSGAHGTSHAAAGVSTPDVLQPHVWQHVQYLQEASASVATQQGQVLQGQQLQAGQQLLLHVNATSADLQLSASLAGPAEAAAGGSSTAADTPQQRPWQGSSDPSRAILPYHLSMLNDHARTEAYERGIAGAVRALLQPAGCSQQSQQDKQQGGVGSSLEQLSLGSSTCGPPVVLDVGCGTGLLSLMAATAAAAAGGSLRITACEREPALAETAQRIIADNSLQQQIRVVQKLSHQLTLDAAAASHTDAAAASSRAKAGKQQPAQPQQQHRQQQPDLPCKASLVVHEIFGTDPLSEHVLPALQQVQQQLAAPGAVFMPSRVRVVAAVAACPALVQRLRIGHTLGHQAAAGTAAAAGAVSAVAAAPGSSHAGVEGAPSSSCQDAPSGALPAWDVSSLQALQPRKLELQLDDLTGQLLLLTAPQPVLELDFQQPIQLAGKQVVQLPALGDGGLLLQQWMQQRQRQQQQQAGPAGHLAPASCSPAEHANYSRSRSSSSSSGGGGGSTAGCAESATAPAAGGAAGVAPSNEGPLLVVSWFEADCGEGGWLSTEPGTTRLGHWQQSVEFVGPPGSSKGEPNSSTGSGLQAAGSGGQSGCRFTLQVSWNNDRVAFALL